MIQLIIKIAIIITVDDGSGDNSDYNIKFKMRGLSANLSKNLW